MYGAMCFLLDKTVVDCVHIQIMLWAHPSVTFLSFMASAATVPFSRMMKETCQPKCQGCHTNMHDQLLYMIVVIKVRKFHDRRMHMFKVWVCSISAVYNVNTNGDGDKIVPCIKITPVNASSLDTLKCQYLFQI